MVSVQLPLAKVKRIMKFDPDTKFVTAEAATVVTLACEMFVKAFTNEACMTAKYAKRRSVQKQDIDACVKNVSWLEFLDGALETWTETTGLGGGSSGRGRPKATAEATGQDGDAIDEENEEGDMDMAEEAEGILHQLIADSEEEEELADESVKGPSDNLLDERTVVSELQEPPEAPVADLPASESVQPMEGEHVESIEEASDHTAPTVTTVGVGDTEHLGDDVTETGDSMVQLSANEYTARKRPKIVENEQPQKP